MFHRLVPFACLCVLAVGLTACNTEPKAPLKVEESFEGTVTARVKAVDNATRVITLQDDKGHEESFVVSDAVKRLNEVKAGDNVTTRYRAKLVAELRPPTAEEKAHPIAVVEASGRATRPAAPAAGATQVVRVVATVEAVDVPNMRVTLRGPLGDLAVVKGKNPDNVRRLKIGDTIVITYTESVAIALEKAAGR